MFTAKLQDGRLKDSYELAKKAFLSIDTGIHVKAYVGVHSQMYAESEFAGKYLDTCVNFYKNTGDAAFLDKAKEVVESILRNQRADGYMGGYEYGEEFGTFGVWNQVFTAYGLLSYYEVVGDERALASADAMISHTANHFLTDVTADILQALNYGSQHITVLLVLPRLYRLTKKQLFADFMAFVVERIKSSDNNFYNGLGVMSYRSQKGIENFIVLLGMLLREEAVGGEEALHACEKYWDELNEKQIRETGNGTVAELWTKEGNIPAFLPDTVKPNETCVSVGWCELSASLFARTGEAKYLDAMEKTLYNHFLGSFATDGKDFAYYQPNFGKRVTRTSDNMYKCCRYRGYNAMSRLEDVLFHLADGTLTPMLYTAASLETDTFSLQEKTAYPYDDIITFTLTPKAACHLRLRLRVPAFASRFTLTVDEEPVCLPVENGYVTLPLSLDKNHINVTLYLHTEVSVTSCAIEGKPYAYARYGAVVLVPDSALGYDVFALSIATNEKHFTKTNLPDYRLAFETTAVVDGKEQKVTLVDYSSAAKAAPTDYTVFIKAI